MNIISFGVTDANMLYPCASALFSLVRSFFLIFLMKKIDIHVLLHSKQD